MTRIGNNFEKEPIEFPDSKPIEDEPVNDSSSTSDINQPDAAAINHLTETVNSSNNLLLNDKKNIQLIEECLNDRKLLINMKKQLNNKLDEIRQNNVPNENSS